MSYSLALQFRFSRQCSVALVASCSLSCVLVYELQRHWGPQVNCWMTYKTRFDAVSARLTMFIVPLAAVVGRLGQLLPARKLTALPRLPGGFLALRLQKCFLLRALEKGGSVVLLGKTGLSRMPRVFLLFSCSFLVPAGPTSRSGCPEENKVCGEKNLLFWNGFRAVTSLPVPAAVASVVLSSSSDRPGLSRLLLRRRGPGEP